MLKMMIYILKYASVCALSLRHRHAYKNVLKVGDEARAQAHIASLYITMYKIEKGNKNLQRDVSILHLVVG